MKCCRKKCERCEKYGETFREYKKEILRQETKNDELYELIYKLLETQKQIVEYLDIQEKVSGVKIKKKST